VGPTRGCAPSGSDEPALSLERQRRRRTLLERAGHGRITPAGVASFFSHPSIDSPSRIAAGSDGNVWFVNAGKNSIGRITPAGVVSNFTDPSINAPDAITSGPDGNPWSANAETIRSDESPPRVSCQTSRIRA
jgi:streptogramin lyase